MLKFQSVEHLNGILYRNTLKDIGFDTKSCEYSYANLYAWRHIYNTTFSKLYDGYVFQLSYKGENHYFAPVVSEKYAVQAYADIINSAKKNGENDVKFICIPEKSALILGNSFENTIIEKDRDNFDYIYEVGKLSEFSGKALHAKRNHKNKFFSLYKEVYRYKSMTESDVPACLEFNEKWYRLNSEFALESERIATEQLLHGFNKLGLFGAMIYVHGELCAYTLASNLHDNSDTLIIHVEKGLYHIHGIYPMVCSEFLKLSGSSYMYVNREDDAGDDGLRKSKLSYKPAFFEEKYSATVHL